jgi:hypothetical protein
LSVHKAVDGLCKKTPILCAAGKMLGIPRKDHKYRRASSWENETHRL